MGAFGSKKRGIGMDYRLLMPEEKELDLSGIIFRGDESKVERAKKILYHAEPARRPIIPTCLGCPRECKQRYLPDSGLVFTCYLKGT